MDKVVLRPIEGEKTGGARASPTVGRFKVSARNYLLRIYLDQWADFLCMRGNDKMPDVIAGAIVHELLRTGGMPLAKLRQFCRVRFGPENTKDYFGEAVGNVQRVLNNAPL